MYLTPAAVSYLTQIILVLAIFGFFVYHTLSQQRLGKTAHARFLLGFFAATTVFILLLFFETALLPAWRLQVVYLENATVGLILLLLLQFAYHFPHLPPHRKWEARLALGLSALYTLAEAGFALYRFAALRQGLVFFRPEWADYALVLGFLWVPVVFVRQAVYASRQEQANPGPGAGGRDLFGLAHLWQPQGQNARAARAFVLVYLLPVGMSLANLLRSYRLISAGLYHASLSVVLLFTLFLFAIAYLNSLPERTTFMVKLVGAALVTVLVVLGLVSWNIMPTYVSNYSVASPQGQTLNFSPNNSGGYTVTVAPFQFESELGSNLGLADALAETDSVALDFTFPFYGQTYRQVYVMNDGVVGLGRPVDHRTIQYHYGVSPAIFPLYLDLIPQAGEGGVYARRDADRLIITWDRVPAFRAQQTTYTFQLILHRDGTFQVSYNDIPPFLTFRPDSDPEDDIWLVGAVPGMGNPAQPGLERLLPQQVDFAGLPLTTGPQGVVFDYYLAFRRQLHQLFVPLAGLILASSVAILLGFPLFFHANLVMPLNALLRGVRRLEAGEYAVNVTVRYADEIGFLTDAFNKLAAQLGDLIRNLETHVVERTTALRASEARMRQITGAMRQAVWLRDTQTLEVLYVNPAYEEIWGRTCASLYADPTSFAQAIHPEDKER
ncbi:MAG: HAMP domain-containing protein, partial [Anaerolineae bacterium]|nr:HAMP domain-containing protein [Anaerolineae bacterium]